MYEGFDKAWSIYQAEMNTAVELSRNFQDSKAWSHNIQKVQPASSNVGIALANLVRLNAYLSADARTTAAAVYTAIRTTIIAIPVGAALMAIAMSILIIRSIMQGITDVTAPMSALAAGDLSASIPF